MQTKPLYIELTIIEPFPVFFSHVGYSSELRPETAKGPFYAANSKWHHIDNKKNSSFVNWQVARLREYGWTVNVAYDVSV